jgi:hypothetical protein
MWQRHSDLAEELTEAPFLNTELVREIGAEHDRNTGSQPQGNCVAALTTMTLKTLPAWCAPRVESTADRRVAESLAEREPTAFLPFTKRWGSYGPAGPLRGRDIFAARDSHRPRFTLSVSLLRYHAFTEVDRRSPHGNGPQYRIPAPGAQLNPIFA